MWEDKKSKNGGPRNKHGDGRSRASMKIKGTSHGRILCSILYSVRVTWFVFFQKKKAGGLPR